MTDEELTYPKKAKRKRGANVAKQEQSKHRKRFPRNNIEINQSAQPANEQQAEGSHSASLQPPCREKNLHGSSVKKKNQPAKRKMQKNPTNFTIKTTYRMSRKLTRCQTHHGIILYFACVIFDGFQR